MSQENIRQDVNGSTDKPFPQERNFNFDVASIQPSGMGIFTPSTNSPDIRLGQAKYAKRAGAESIYKDATRNTADDNEASRKTESEGCADNYEENQGI